jgi:hypothetical protein
MTWSSDERLYRLLPAIHRVRDAAQGEPLRALLSVIEQELKLIETDIEGLYDNWFVETAAEWAIPYLGDLLGVRPLHTAEGAASFSQRAYVANTLRYRRRKGTAAVLEQLARDVSGWPARVVEFFQLLGSSQHLNHVRLYNLRTPDLRATGQLELIGTPFETATRTAEVRSIASGRGKYNIPNVGLYLWRLQAYSVVRSSARAVSGPPNRRYTFSPLGVDAPLFNRPQTETEITHLAEEVNVPGALRRRALYDDLEAMRQAIANNQTPRSRYFGEQPVFQLFLDEGFSAGLAAPVPAEEILICDLSDWRQPPDALSYARTVIEEDGTVTTEEVPMTITAAVDPALGRITFPSGHEPETVHVSYAYGFSSDVGGGPYDRSATVRQALTREVNWQVGVAQSPELAPVGDELIFPTLADAVAAWNSLPAGAVGVIALLDSYSYTENLTGSATIQIPAGSQLAIIAAEWPATEIPDSLGQQQRSVGQFAATGLRPHFRGDLSVRGTAPGESAGELILDGLLIEGRVRVLVGNLGSLQLNHCTLVPGVGGLTVNATVGPSGRNSRLRVGAVRSILGDLTLPESVPALVINESIVDHASGAAVAAPGAACTVDASTIAGAVTVRSLEASNSIFTAPLLVERRQVGCVRFCAVTEGSRTPRRHRCQPDLALGNVKNPAKQATIRTRLTPLFSSTTYGDPAYFQLSATCAQEIQTGVEDGAEMGVYYHLKQPQRSANLRTALDEYLPFGLRAGLIYVT